ncbi:hypothetical protein AGOR_G00138880 [Albula goreensis]|uniref:Plectin/eS10 N-terminal domain-containing protein n=1 Tax=Albula goreensis TaxID=1534307 RepID=A0A8T3D9V8_9TELE|nr:hypothetical protein AGOR_G00138880 [Albula goreensis]
MRPCAGPHAHEPPFPSGLKFKTVKMLMPKKNRIAIYELLFKEGVMVAKKDVHLAKHPELADKNVPNLHVMKAMQSLKSCGYVKEQFAWRHFYWYLTNEGIQYLRDFLHLPPEIVPATLRRQMRPRHPGPGPKAWRGTGRLACPEVNLTERHTGAQEHQLVVTRRPRRVLGPLRSSSSEAGLDVGVEDSHLSESAVGSHVQMCVFL